jgi:hypothetical protein
MLLGAIGPLGSQALTFPVQLLQRQELLSNVIEWQAPAFTSISQRAFLLQLVAAIVLLARRPAYRTALPTAVFMAAALLGSRNLAVASIAMLPGMAAALTGVGTLSSSTRPRQARVLTLLAVAIAALLIGVRLQGPALRLTAYPVDVLAYLEAKEVDTRHERLAAPELVGNLMTFVYGADNRVFYDDRFDMFPAVVSDAALAMQEAAPSVFADLGHLDVDLVTVRRTSPMALALARDAGWRILYVDDHWQLTCRRGADLGGSITRC